MTIKNNLDKAIHQSLSQEDQDFLASLDEEPMYFQAMGIYKGKLGIINWITTIGIILMSIVMIFALIRFFNVSPDIAGMLKWGGLAALCVGGITGSKIFLGLHWHTNRVLRELKKLELQIVSIKQNQS